MKYQYPCPWCDDGVADCECCGQETKCTACDGTGLDANRLDIEKFKDARRAMWKAHGGSGRSLVENGVVVGACGGILGAPPVWSLRYDDFLRGGGA